MLRLGPPELAQDVLRHLPADEALYRVGEGDGGREQEAADGHQTVAPAVVVQQVALCVPKGEKMCLLAVFFLLKTF